MDANEARRRADSVNSVRDNNQYVEVKKAIAKRVDEGQYDLTFWSALRQEVRARLVNEGYTVSPTRSGGQNEQATDIVWSHSKSKE